MNLFRQHIAKAQVLLLALLTLALAASAPGMREDGPVPEGIVFGDAWVANALPVAQKTEVRDVLLVHPSLREDDGARGPREYGLLQADGRSISVAVTTALYLLYRNLRR